MTSTAMVTNESTTKKRLLGAMQGLVAERGFDAVSVRDITGLAHANVAAVNYHFGSREGMVQAVVEHRLRQLVVDRQDALQAAATGSSLEHLLQMWAMPLAMLQANSGEAELRFCRVMGRCLEVANSLPAMPIVKEMRAVDESYLQLIIGIFPTRTASDLRWKWHFCQGSLIHSLVHGHLLSATLPLQRQLELWLETACSSFGGLANPLPQRDAPSPSPAVRTAKQATPTRSVIAAVAEAMSDNAEIQQPDMPAESQPPPIESVAQTESVAPVEISPALQATEDDGYGGMFLF